MANYFVILIRDNGFQGDEYDSEPPAQSAEQFVTDNHIGDDFGWCETLGAVLISDELAESIIKSESYHKIKE